MSDLTTLVREYLDALTAGPDGLAAARELLADDLDYHDPLLPITDADDLISRLEQLDPSTAAIELVEMAAGTDVVAVLTSFTMPMGEQVAFTQWFWIKDGKISRSRVIYDPRPFLALADAEG